MPERYRCAVASREHAEDVSGTASTVRRWVVVEQPGPWGSDAVLQSGLPVDVARELRRRARGAGARLLLIRRGGSGPPRRAFVAFSGPDGPWLEEHRFDDPVDLLDLDLGRLRPGGGSGGRRLDGPLVLTCTNGRHDACCAEFGRPVAAALEARLHDAAWEVSHIGGDRFAPNVLVLPHGVYYGRVAVSQVPVLARAVVAGRIWLEGYRGRSVHPFAVQAAEAALRRARRNDGLADVVVAGWERRGERTRVQLTAAGTSWEVEVETLPNDDAWALTCSAADAARPPVHRIVRIQPRAQG